MQLDVARSPELSAVVAALATVPREVAKEVRQHSKRVIGPVWKRALAEHAPAPIFHKRLVAPAAVYLSDRGVKLVAGSSRASNFTRETEFGAYREQYNEYTRRGHRVNRRTQRQFYHFNPKGHTVYPAAREIIPRVGALWAQTTFRTIFDTVEDAL